MTTDETETHSNTKDWVTAGVVLVVILVFLSLATVVFTQHSKDNDAVAREAHKTTAIRFLDSFTGDLGVEFPAERILTAPGDKMRVCVSPDLSHYELWSEFPSTDSPYIYHSTANIATMKIDYDEAFYGALPSCVTEPEDKKETEIVLVYKKPVGRSY